MFAGGGRSWHERPDRLLTAFHWALAPVILRTTFTWTLKLPSCISSSCSDISPRLSSSGEDQLRKTGLYSGGSCETGTWMLRKLPPSCGGAWSGGKISVLSGWVLSCSSRRCAPVKPTCILTGMWQGGLCWLSSPDAITSWNVASKKAAACVPGSIDAAQVQMLRKTLETVARSICFDPHASGTWYMEQLLERLSTMEPTSAQGPASQDADQVEQAWSSRFAV